MDIIWANFRTHLPTIANVLQVLTIPRSNITEKQVFSVINKKLNFAQLRSWQITEFHHGYKIE